MTGLLDVDVVLTGLAQWRREVCERVGLGARLAGLYCTHRGDQAQLRAVLISAAGITCLRCDLAEGAHGRLEYPSLTPDVPAAFWYERAMHDLSGVIPAGHPRLDPLLLPRQRGQQLPRPGHTDTGHTRDSALEEHGPVDVSGHGIFTLPLGPVRSGVVESIEFLIETPGEDIPHLTIRPHFKHRGIAKRFEGRSIANGVLVAERVEGIASVAHALAYSHAVESITGVTPPPRARLIRVIHAELERIANHLDVAMRLSDAAGLGVAIARFGLHKETTMRLVSQLAGNRFARSVIVPGGIADGYDCDPHLVWQQVARLAARIDADRHTLMNDATFIDRVRGTGRLAPELAHAHGALGPVGRGSGVDNDVRRAFPYDGYTDLQTIEPAARDEGDALARLRVRWAEVDSSVKLIRCACVRLAMLTDQSTRVPVPPADGYAVGLAESPQGEVLYGLEVAGDRIVRCFARCASLHNMVLFHDVFHGDVFTDFAFIEASFGLCYAGVAM